MLESVEGSANYQILKTTQSVYVLADDCKYERVSRRCLEAPDASANGLEFWKQP